MILGKINIMAKYETANKVGQGHNNADYRIIKKKTLWPHLK